MPIGQMGPISQTQWIPREIAVFGVKSYSVAHKSFEPNVVILANLILSVCNVGKTAQKWRQKGGTSMSDALRVSTQGFGTKMVQYARVISTQYEARPVSILAAVW
jgi:hypothetical protein